MAPTRFPQLRKLADTAALAERAAELGIDLPSRDAGAGTGADPLGRPLATPIGTLANRFAILPMEGWDGTAEGAPTELTTSRWRRFGDSGAALIWGGEAVAVRADGRANPNQLVLVDRTAAAIGGLRDALLEAHRERVGSTDGLLVGLQLTHSGRFARPLGVPAPRIAWPHPLLDRRVGLSPGTAAGAVLGDDELDVLREAYVAAASLAADLGFDFVDVKACHGYLVHELLGARQRPGRFGGDLEGRSRFLLEVLEAIATARPALGLAVRLSVFDGPPYTAGPDGVGRPERTDPGEPAPPAPFGASDEPLEGAEVDSLIGRLRDVGVAMVCVSAASPYYNPHLQRPALFPPSDGYDPPEDPLVGVARLLDAARRLRAAHPGLVVVGSGFSYLQEHLPAVGRGAVSDGWVDSVGLGRMALSYPDLAADVLAGRPLQQRLLCRTFSDCTTAPRNGMVSGCYPLDPAYRDRPERARLVQIKRAAR